MGNRSMEEKMTVSYTRISEEDLEKSKEFSVSIYNQLNLIKDYAERMNLKVEKDYIDGIIDVFVDSLSPFLK